MRLLILVLSLSVPMACHAENIQDTFAQLQNRFSGFRPVASPLLQEKSSKSGLPKEEVEKLILQLGNEDPEARAIAFNRLEEHYDSQIEALLKSHLKNSDPEISSRVKAILRGQTEAGRLEKKLSAGLRGNVPQIADWALSSKEEDIKKALKHLEDVVGDNSEVLKEEGIFTTKEDVKILLPAILDSLVKINKDWAKLDEEIKFTLLPFVIPAHNQVLKENKLADKYSPNLESLLVDDNPLFRGYALTLLTILRPGEKSIEQAAAMLKDVNPTARQFAIKALIGGDKKKYAPKIFEILKKDPDESVRVDCIYYLKNTFGKENEEAVRAIQDAMKDAHKDVSVQAMLNLQEMKLLSESLQKTDAQTAVRCIGILKEYRYHSVSPYIEVLESLYNSPHPEVAEAAKEAVKAAEKQ